MTMMKGTAVKAMGESSLQPAKLRASRAPPSVCASRVPAPTERPLASGTPLELPVPPLVPERAWSWRPPVLSPCPLRQASRAPTRPPHWMLYGAGRAC